MNSSIEAVLIFILVTSAVLHPVSPGLFAGIRLGAGVWMGTGMPSVPLLGVLLALSGVNLGTVDWLVVGVALIAGESNKKRRDVFEVAVTVWLQLLLVLSINSLSPYSHCSTFGLSIGLEVTVVAATLIRRAIEDQDLRLKDNKEEAASLEKEIKGLESHLHPPTAPATALRHSTSSEAFSGDILRKLKSLTPARRELSRAKSNAAVEPPLFPSSMSKRKFSFSERGVESISIGSEESLRLGQETEQVTFPSNDSSGGMSFGGGDLSHEDVDGLITNIMSHEYVLWHHRLKRPHGLPTESSLLNQLQQFTSSMPGVSRTTFNPSSMVRVPLQVLMEENEELAEVMSHLGDWDFNMLDLVRCTSEPLKEVSYYLFSTHSLPEKFAISRPALVKFLRETEKRYRKENFYHNSLHAADVLNSVVSLLSSGLHRCGHFLDLEVFGLMAAALGHDVNHPGVNNSFLINNLDPLALRYNDRSVLEMMHSSTLFLIFSKPDCNILTGLAIADFHRFRKIVIDLILATDLQRHFSIQADYRRDLEESAKSLIEEDFRLQTLEICIKCADLGHGAKETPVHLQWTELISHEFFTQGDQEQALGLPLSPLCARGLVDIPKAQIGFLTIMVKPLFTLWEELVQLHGNWEEETEEWPFLLGCRRIGENLQFWEEEVNKVKEKGGEFRLREAKPPMMALVTV